MTKKQIEKKAEELGIKYQTPCHGVGDCEFEARQAATEMAEWLLSHQWVSVEDELPPINKETNKSKKCFVRGDGAYGVTYQSAEYNADRKGWEGFTFSPDNITHWMPIPPLAEEGGEDD